jgi:hypothetical protein
VPDAQRHYTGDSAKPRLRVTVLFGRYMVAGAVPAETLYRAAENVLGEVSDEEGEA